MTNIEIFDLFAAQIFGKLYESFPVPIDIDLSDAPLEGFNEDETSDVVFDKLVIFEKTLDWLISAGYINAQLTTYDGAHNVVLSAKGLEVLKLPSSLEPNGPSFGEKIVGSIKSGAIQAAGAAANAAFTKGLGFVLGSA